MADEVLRVNRERAIKSDQIREGQPATEGDEKKRRRNWF